MIIREDYFKFDDRCLSHPGVILDIGCLSWDWSTYFLDKKKKVIGFDCNEQSRPNGVELRRQMILPNSGKSLIYGKGGAASAMNLYKETDGMQYDVVSLDSVLSEFT